MPRETVILQVFVASPSDVSDERDSLETVVMDLNKIWSKNLGVTFELTKWETHSRPSFGSDPQAIINEQLGEDYDVFIGIFWSRLGTPTPRSQSGTIEEFTRAYERFKSTGSLPEIMLYFKDAPIAPTKIDPDQLRALQVFRSSISGLGGLYSVFEDSAGFESSLRAHLSAIAQKFGTQRQSSVSDRGTLPPSELSDANDQFPVDDYGYIDYLEIHENRMAEMTAAIEAINAATVRVGEQASQGSAEMQGEMESDPSAGRRFIRRIAENMNAYADTLNSQVSILSATRKAAFDALTNALVLRNEFPNKATDLPSLRQRLSALMESTSSAKSGMTSMRTSVDGLPRISKDLNAAKRSVVLQVDKFLTEVESTGSTVSNVIEAIDRMLEESGGQ